MGWKKDMIIGFRQYHLTHRLLGAWSKAVRKIRLKFSDYDWTGSTEQEYLDADGNFKAMTPQELGRAWSGIRNKVKNEVKQ